ncbi:MAG: hypothetical protein ACN4E4_06660, partial [Methyloversatilis discipulorum]
MKRSTLALFILAAFAHGGPVHAGVTTADIENDARTTGDVLSWGMGTEGQRYSPLTKINTKNVKRLVPAWSYSYGGEKQRGQEAQPLVVGGKMFITASYSRIFALDTKTGRKLWSYEHRLPEGIMPCCDVITAHTDSTAPLAEIAKEGGSAWGFGQASDM